MKIYDINDKVILDVPVTKEAVHEQEMSKSDYVKLSWVSDAKQILPAGTYIVPFKDGLHYRLLEPYTPNQNSEIEWKYQPEFQHPLMWLSKIPFTYTTVDSSKNLSYTSQDWPYLGLTTSLLQVVVNQINDLFGFIKDDDKFTYEIIGEVSTTVNCTFSSTSILSALSTIANAASTDNTVEWHLSWEHRCLYFGQISINLGEEIPTLKVGTNIGKVSVTDTKDEYYNVFFPQGSTRNISTRLTNGHYLASSLRLGLNFPSGISYTNAFATISSVESNKKEENYFRLTLDLEYVQTYFNEPLPQYGNDIYVVRLRIDNCTVNARVEGHGDTANVRIYSEYLENATDPDDNADKENFYAFQDKIAVGAKVYLDGGVNIYNLPEANKETVSEKFDLQYPDGTIDIRTNKNEPKQVLALTFDDVYPHVNCYVYNVRSRTSILKKSNSTEDALDKDGNPIKYSIWYFRLAYPLSAKEEGCLLNEGGTPYTTVLDGVTYYWYDYYVNKDKDIIDGYKTSLQFTANAHEGAYPQPLLGQPSATEGFEVECHQSATTVKLDDGTTVKKGDYEITYVEQNDLIIPTTGSDGLYPRGDKMPNFKANEAIVYNVVMGANEIKAAQDELLLKTKKEIERRKQDLNNYSFSSYPNIFEDSSKNPNLYIGKTIVFDDGAGNKLSTRVIKLTTKLDHAFEQSIIVGNQKIKGTTSQLKEDVQTIMSGNWNGGGGLNTAQIKNLIRTIGRSEYLRKDQDDETTHKLTMGEAEVTGDAAVGGDLHVDKGTTTTHNLTVTGTAHFFELQVDKITAGSGGRIMSAADGFTVADVGTVSDGRVKVYWLAQDNNGRAVMNMWRVNDQAICMSFNLGQLDETGKGQMVANKYYWCLVTAVSGMTPETRTVNGVEGKYNWIELSTQTKAEGCTVNPAVGDDIAQLGYEGTDDETRQCATYETSYFSLDPDLKPPFRAVYCGISDFNLSSHRDSYKDAHSGIFNGTLKILDKRPDVLTLTQAHNGLVTQTTPDVVDISIKDGYGRDVMPLYTLNVERDSGDVQADALWNMSHKNVKFPLSISYSDLSTMGLAQSIFFTVKAVSESRGKLSASVYEKLDSTRKFYISFTSNRRVVYDDDVDMAITAHIMYGDDDYTDKFLADSRSQFTWTRNSGVEAEDNAWKPTTGESGNILLVEHHINSNKSRLDCGSRWTEALHVEFSIEAKVYLDSVPTAKSLTVPGTVGIGTDV